MFSKISSIAILFTLLLTGCSQGESDSSKKIPFTEPPPVLTSAETEPPPPLSPITIVTPSSDSTTAPSSDATVKPAEPINPTEPITPVEPTEDVPPVARNQGPAVPPSPEEIVVEDGPTPEELLDEDLLAYHEGDTSGFSPEIIRAKNDASIRSLYEAGAQVNISPDIEPSNRVTAITPAMAQQLIDSISAHPVVGYTGEKYSQPGTEIGYCFGRATYVHLALLKMGVAKESIRKVWLVGTMFSSEVNWAFHVAVAVKSTSGEWLVVDSFTGRALEVGKWAEHFYPYNDKYKNLRLYITEASKFSVSLSKYSRSQLGLDLPVYKDWYKNYFLDLMKWFQKNKMSAMGLPNDLREKAEMAEQEKTVPLIAG